jgi:hypothetical protein
VLVTTLDTRDVQCLPFDWDVIGLEDIAHRLGDFSTDTVTCSLSDPVLNSSLSYREKLAYLG